jgi:hypothetical protein
MIVMPDLAIPAAVFIVLASLALDALYTARQRKGGRHG